LWVRINSSRKFPKEKQTFKTAKSIKPSIPLGSVKLTSHHNPTKKPDKPPVKHNPKHKPSKK
jgi:hypothetical protein